MILNDLFEDPTQALQFATDAHGEQTRADGSPYISHPIRVAEIVKKYKTSKAIDDLVSAAYLHDVIEDTDITLDELVKKFGQRVASLVHELTSHKPTLEKIGKAKYLVQKMIEMSNWALVIKLADRLDNVSDIKTAKTPEWREKYKNDTLKILNTLEQRRDLSKTHLTLIDKIKEKLAEV